MHLIYTTKTDYRQSSYLIQVSLTVHFSSPYVEGFESSRDSICIRASPVLAPNLVCIYSSVGGLSLLVVFSNVLPSLVFCCVALLFMNGFSFSSKKFSLCVMRSDLRNLSAAISSNSSSARPGIWHAKLLVCHMFVRFL